MVPDDLKYSKEHEWVRVTGDVATIGITHYAQDQLGDIVEVELPKVGTNVEQMKECGAVESVKTASDIFSPVTGEVTETNPQVARMVDGKKNAEFHPDRVNSDPYGEGWFFKVRLTNKAELDGLMGAEQYKEFIKA
ncbi:MAG: glycine cleavage system protein GcvH [Candidatus Xenobia bacterium]